MTRTSLGALIGGSVLVEQIYDYPGMGRLLTQATSNRDYPLMQAILLFMIMAVLIANLVADLLYGVLDPRARSGSEIRVDFCPNFQYSLAFFIAS